MLWWANAFLNKEGDREGGGCKREDWTAFLIIFPMLCKLLLASKVNRLRRVSLPSFHPCLHFLSPPSAYPLSLNSDGRRGGRQRFWGGREGARRVNWASLVFGTLQSAVEEEGGHQGVNIGWVSWDTVKAKENGPSRSCKDTLHFFVDLEKLEAVALNG